VGQKVDFLATDKAFYNIVSNTGKKQFARRKRAYQSIAIFEYKDLIQELWVSLLECELSGRLLNIFMSCENDFSDFVISLAEIIGRKGQRKVKEIEEIPFSQLEEKKRHELSNSLYGDYRAFE